MEVDRARDVGLLVGLGLADHVHDPEARVLEVGGEPRRVHEEPGLRRDRGPRAREEQRDAEENDPAPHGHHTRMPGVSNGVVVASRKSVGP